MSFKEITLTNEQCIIKEITLNIEQECVIKEITLTNMQSVIKKITLTSEQCIIKEITLASEQQCVIKEITLTSQPLLKEPVSSALHWEGRARLRIREAFFHWIICLSRITEAVFTQEAQYLCF